MARYIFVERKSRSSSFYLNNDYILSTVRDMKLNKNVYASESGRCAAKNSPMFFTFDFLKINSGRKGSDFRIKYSCQLTHVKSYCVWCRKNMEGSENMLSSIWTIKAKFDRK